MDDASSYSSPSRALFLLASLQCYNRLMIRNAQSDDFLGDVQILEYMLALCRLVCGNFDHDCKDATLGVQSLWCNACQVDG